MFWRRNFHIRRTSLWAIGCLTFVVVVGLCRLGENQKTWVYICGGTLAMGLLMRKRSFLLICVVVIAGGYLGHQRGNQFIEKSVAYQPYYAQHVSFTARAMNDGIYATGGQMSFDAKNIRLQNGQALAGKIQVRGFGVNAVYQDDVLRMTGKLYQARGSFQGRISYAQLQLEERHPSPVSVLRRKFTAGMQTALPEPLAPFAMGILVGQRATLPDETKQNLLMVGLTHIIAVSGYNLTIILHATKGILGRKSKRLNLGFSLGLIIMFLLITGMSASIVRAAIVSGLSIVAGYYGRTFRPVTLIALAAAITAWSNPFYVWGDLGWYLSFLAFFGILVIAPVLNRSFGKRWQNNLFLMVMIESLSAEIMTLPFVLYIFGQVSLISLLANVLIVTLMPLAMLMSLFAGLGGMLAGSISGWFAWPADIILNYMLDTARLLASLPGVFRQNIGLSLGQMLGLYIAAGSLMLGLRKRQSANFLL